MPSVDTVVMSRRGAARRVALRSRVSNRISIAASGGGSALGCPKVTAKCCSGPPDHLVVKNQKVRREREQVFWAPVCSVRKASCNLKTVLKFQLFHFSVSLHEASGQMYLFECFLGGWLEWYASYKWHTFENGLLALRENVAELDRLGRSSSLRGFFPSFFILAASA